MNTYFTKALFFVLLLLLSVNVSAQKKNRHLRAADEAYNNKQYSLAVDKYKKGYSKIKSDRKEKARVSFLLAQCYRYTNNYRRAKAFYKRALRMDYANQNPEAFLIYADMLLISGEYEDALEAYQKYSEYVPDNPSSLVGVESCKIAPTWLKNPTNFEIDKFNKINSKSDDFAPAYADAYFSSIIFTSNREEATGDEEDPWTGQKFSDLFYAKQDRKGDWSTPALIDKKEKVNTTGNEGKPAFNKLYTTMYFTRCQTDPEKPSGCQIYKATRSGKNWGTPKEIQFSKDSTDVFGHPTINSDETMIIFASDIPGTSGGKDLYYATRESISDPFERPINLGELVNTEKDEMFPFLRNDSTLYFSSNGHIGMGGLDIYKSELKNGVWQTPENMKYPINTNYDDFSITIQPNRDEGFFASNRKGARGGDDIFHFLNPPLEFTLSGIVKNENSLQFVEKADVKLIGSDGSSVKAITDPKGFFSFSQSQIKPNTSYEIVIEKENYFNKKATESTVGIEKSQEIVRNLTLQPIPDKPILLPEILYDLGKWELKSQYQDSLQGLIETLDANQTIIVELAAHTDTRASDEFNDILSQKRAESVVDYLIKRGIDPVRLVAKGYGERVP
ncbi:MAG: OmpA family protein, partial [Bacteroidota bacterium]|nr:OmpA family protein [Bacteroidota bacterium]